MSYKHLSFLMVILPFHLFAKPIDLPQLSALTPPPNVIRTCCAFGNELRVARIPFVRKTDIISIEDLGTHIYLGDKSEGNGIIYTTKGGFIDIGHLRDYVDWTAYLYNVIREGMEKKENLRISFGTEGGAKTLEIKSSFIGSDIDIAELAGKIAYDLSLWHEIATWFGTSYLPLVPERYSSFSPEDLYSNLLGVKIGIAAIKSDLPFEMAVTEELLKSLRGIESVETFSETYLAMDRVEGIWWTRKKALPSNRILLKRYLDSDLSLKPWLIPGRRQALPVILEKPSESLSKFYSFQIKANYKIPVRKIWRDQIKVVIDQADFKDILRFIEQDQALFDALTIRRLNKSNTRKISKSIRSLRNENEEMVIQYRC